MVSWKYRWTRPVVHEGMYNESATNLTYETGKEEEIIQFYMNLIKDDSYI